MSESSTPGGMTPRSDLLVEYQELGENMRYLGARQDARMTLYLGASGFLLLVLLSQQFSIRPEFIPQVVAAGAGVTVVFLVSQRRIWQYWNRYRARARELERVLGFEQYQRQPRRIPLLSQYWMYFLLYVGFLVFWVWLWVSREGLRP